MIKIIALGNIKETFFKESVLEYQKRISKYTKLEIIEIKESDSLAKEKEAILKHIEPKDYVVCLAIEGESLSSIEFSRKLDQWLMQNKNVTFIIGSSQGLDEEIKKQSDIMLSFSALTFPHQLFRIILLEQIYRAFKIKNNETYHK